MSSQAVAARIDKILGTLSEFLKAISGPDLEAAAREGACDFLAGNPQEITSDAYVAALKRWAEPLDKDWYGYKMAHPPALEAAARGLTEELGIEFAPGDIVLARGAHGALGAALAAVVDPGDEVVFVSPPWFFYEAMILGVDATPVKTRIAPPHWDLDVDAIAQSITARTRVVLLNTPHNPTGRIFSADSLKALAALLEEASERNRRPVYILSDEAYSRILFDGNAMVSPASFYPRSFLVHTYSKSALTPGQRLGYLALPPDMPDKEQIHQALLAVGVATGNWLPDAIMQYALADIEKISIDIPSLQSKRDRMVEALRSYGYELHVPEATFYLLVKSPTPDDAGFTQRLRGDNVLVMPGRAVDLPGYVRISLTATEEMIDRALPVFERAIKEY